MSGKVPAPRKGMPDVQLDEAEFKRRFKSQFTDPAFAPLAAEVERIAHAAWDGYANARKSPRTRKAGAGYADPDYDLAIDWLETKAAVDQARAEYEDPAQPPWPAGSSFSPSNFDPATRGRELGFMRVIGAPFVRRKRVS